MTTTQKALVTGANGAIGSNICQLLIDNGWHVAGIDRKFSHPPRESESLRLYQCDLADGNHVDDELNRIVADFGLPDLLVNCVGTIHNEALMSFQKGKQVVHGTDSWRSVLSANLDAPFFVTRLLAAQCIRKGKSLSVVNFSSISARGRVGQAAYSASKAGLEALTRTMGLELGRLGVRCNTIALGFIESDSMRANLSTDIIDTVKMETSVGRLGNFDDVLSAILLCANNSFLNATTIHLDGGL